MAFASGRPGFATISELKEIPLERLKIEFARIRYYHGKTIR
jgi:hypothetical protein